MGQFIYKSLVFLPPTSTYEIGENIAGLDITSFSFGDHQIPFVLTTPPSPPAGDASPFCLLYSHGNAEDLGQLLDLFASYRDTLGISVAAYDYLGYGPSQQAGAQPDEQRCYRVALAAFRHLTESCGVPPSKVVLYGRSLGTGPTTWLAAHLSAEETAFGGVVLQSPLTSAISVVSEFLSYLAVDMFPNRKRIRRIRRPIMIVHGEEDVVVPFAHGRQLAGMLQDPEPHSSSSLSPLSSSSTTSTSPSSPSTSSPSSTSSQHDHPLDGLSTTPPEPNESVVSPSPRSGPSGIVSSSHHPAARRLFRFVNIPQAGHNDIEFRHWELLSTSIRDYLLYLQSIDPDLCEFSSVDTSFLSCLV